MATTNPFAQFLQPEAQNPFAQFAVTPEGTRPVQPGEIPTASGFLPLPPEEPRRTLGQRILGAATAPLDVAATLASGVGRAAATLPYALVTGRGIEPGFRELMQGVRQPQTPEGRAMLEAAAPALEALPPVVGTGPALFGPGVPAAQQAGRVVGQEARLVGGAIEQARAGRAEKQALARSAEDWARAPQIEAANRAVELGIALNPAVSNPTLPNRARSTLVGNRDVNAMLAKQNAPKWTELAKRDMGISTQTRLNAKGFEEARNAVSGPYDRLRRMGAMTASDDIRRALDSLRVEEAAIGAEPSAKRVNKLVNEALNKIESGMNGPKALESIRQLRSDAQVIRNAQKTGQAPSPDEIAEASAKMRIAGVLENMVEENIFDPKFKGEFRNARAALAKTYAYEEATDFNTGQIDPVAISRLTASDNALTGIIADIGAIAGNFPEVATAGAPSTLLQRTGSQITRSGISGTIGAGIGAVTPIGPIGGGVAGAAAGELITGLQSRRIGTPEYQRRFAAPQDRRIFPQNELAPQPANALTPYIAPQTILEPQKGAFVTGAGPVPLRRSAESGAFVAPDVAPPAGPALTPRAQFVGPQSGPPQLPAPSAEATMAGLRAEDARRASVSRAIGQETEARQAAAETAARRPAGGEVILELDPTTGRLREASQGVKGATPETFRNFGANLQSAASKVTAGRNFDLTAAEKVAWERTKVDLAEVSPGFKALSDKAIAEKMMDRQWVEAQVIKTREKIAAFDEIARRAKDAQARQKAIADRTRLQYDVLAQLEALEERLSGPRPTSAGGQGPKTRAAKAAAQRNALTPSSSNALND